MSYTIEALPITTFLDDSTMKLPRFQRKATWKSTQNFELAISVFQDYPVGVVIVNKERNQSWLLDGRQRRTALRLMRENPVELYNWARSYIKFGAREDTSELRRKYWANVEKYLQTDPASKADESAEGENLTTDQATDIDPIDDDYSFDSSQQREGLQTLLDLILMVHQVSRGVSRWEKLFDFTDYFALLPYAPRKADYKVQPTLLRKWLLETSTSIRKEGELTKETFVEHCLDNCALRDQDKSEAKFKNAVDTNWTDIEQSIEVICKAEKIFSDARIGVINLTKASPLDAQNIFSRINAGGTQLTAEELLSAKPYWNKEVIGVDDITDNAISKLYKNLGVPKPDTVVRWDIAATLLSRIDSRHLIFDKYDDTDISLDKVSLGFKLLSSLIVGGMSAKSVIELEGREDIDWNRDVNKLVDEINKVCEVLLNIDIFQFLNSWNRPLTWLLSNATALEFLTIVWKDWVDEGRPTASSGSASLHTVQRNAKVLFDRLVYEYATRQWRGSGDSRMARDIKDWSERLVPVSENDWLGFIEDASRGTYNGQQTTVSTIKPVLYYYYVLSDVGPGPFTNVSFDVDHIIPQEKFKGNQSVDQNMKDSLGNLALLPKKDNITKNNKLLSEVNDAWLKSQINYYTGIDQSDFDKYSSVSSVGELAQYRLISYKEAFSMSRSKKLSN